MSDPVFTLSPALDKALRQLCNFGWATDVRELVMTEIREQRARARAVGLAQAALVMADAIGSSKRWSKLAVSKRVGEGIMQLASEDDPGPLARGLVALAALADNHPLSPSNYIDVDVAKQWISLLREPRP